MSDYTSIRIRKATAKKLQNLGMFNQSYDELVNDLCDLAEQFREDWDTRLIEDEDEGKEGEE